MSITADLPRSVERPTHLRHLVLAALLVITSINYAQRNAIGPAAPVIEQDLKLTLNQVGLVMSAFFLSYTLMQVPAGGLAQRIGAKWCSCSWPPAGRWPSPVAPGNEFPHPLRRPSGPGRVAGRHLFLRHAHSQRLVSRLPPRPGDGAAQQFHAHGRSGRSPCSPACC